MTTPSTRFSSSNSEPIPRGKNIEEPLNFSINQEWEHANGKLFRVVNTPNDSHKTWVPAETCIDPLDTWWDQYRLGTSPTPIETSRETVRVAELFSGPGGFALGTRQAVMELGYEFQSVLAVDIDEEALKIYQHNHATEHIDCMSASMLVSSSLKRSKDTVAYRYPPELADGRVAPYLRDIDVLLAGPPCQGHSNLNNRTRRTDERNALYLTVPDVAIAANIPIVVIENVPAVIHDQSGHDVVETTKKLLVDNGYSIETGVLKSHAFGWPQTRSRHFLIARSEAAPGAPFPLTELTKVFAAKPRSIMTAISDLESKPLDNQMHRIAKYSEENIERMRWLHNNTENGFDLPPERHNPSHQQGTTYKGVYGRLDPDAPCGTITTGFMTPGRGRYVHPTQMRTLTPHEAARIQGFPDTYRFQLPGEQPPTSALLTKWIGDAVPMPLGYTAALSALGPGLPKN